MTSPQDSPRAPLDGPYSDKAEARFAEILAKQQRGEPIKWMDLRGICEPHPDRTDCPSWESTDGPQCQLPRGHEGSHRAEVEW